MYVCMSGRVAADSASSSLHSQSSIFCTLKFMCGLYERPFQPTPNLKIYNFDTSGGVSYIRADIILSKKL